MGQLLSQSNRWLKLKSIPAYPLYVRRGCGVSPKMGKRYYRKKRHCIQTVKKLEIVSRSLCCDLFISDLSLFAFTSLTLAFQLFTRKLCLQISGLKMRSFTWNQFPIKNLPIDSLLTPIVESNCLNIDMCKLESSQKMKADSSRLIPPKLTENPGLLVVSLKISYFLALAINARQ